MIVLPCVRNCKGKCLLALALCLFSWNLKLEWWCNKCNSLLFLLPEVVIDSHINSWSFSMDSQLGEYEQKHQITQRWKPADKEFVDAKHSYFKEKQQLLHVSMRAVTVKRQFLLKLKTKYAGKLSLSHSAWKSGTPGCVINYTTWTYAACWRQVVLGGCWHPLKY